MKRKIILSSILSIVICLSLIAGSTLALFTSTSSVNIAVNSAKVDVKAVIGNIELYSLDVLQPGMTFENGGTAALSGSDITLTNITPGDMIKFPIIADNHSTVKIKYSVTVHADGPLAPYLNSTITIGETEYKLEPGTATTPWVTVYPGEDIDPVKVSILLPVEFEDQSLETAKLSVTLNAIQYNGQADSTVTLNGYGYDTLEEALAEAKSGETIVISSNQDLIGAPGTSQIRDFKGVTVTSDNNSSITFKNVAGSNSTGTCSIANLNLKNVTFVDETFYTGENGENAWEFTYFEIAGTNKFENVTFTDGIFVEDGHSDFVNCTFIGHNNDSSSYGNGTMYGAWVYSGSANFIGCNFSGTRGLKVADQYADSDVTDVTVDKCFFGPLSEKPGIAVDNRRGKLTLNITDCTFAGTQAGDGADNPANGVPYVYENDNKTPADTVINLSGEKVAPTAKTQEEITAGAKTKNAIVVLPAGEWTLPALADGVTIVGTEGTVVKQADGSEAALGSTHNTTIKNVTFEGTNAQRWGYASGTVVFENCTFKGQGTDKLSWAIHYDDPKNANILYKNCTIYGWVAIGGGAASLEFDGCQFYGNGAFGLCRSYSDFTVRNCTFDYSDVDPNGTRSVGIEALSGATVTVINCTNVNGDIEDVCSHKYDGTEYEGTIVIVK